MFLKLRLVILSSPCAELLGVRWVAQTLRYPVTLKERSKQTHFFFTSILIIWFTVGVANTCSCPMRCYENARLDGADFVPAQQAAERRILPLCCHVHALLSRWTTPLAQLLNILLWNVGLLVRFLCDWKGITWELSKWKVRHIIQKSAEE